MTTDLEQHTAIRSGQSEQVIEYITQLLGELAEMATSIGHTELADRIRFSGLAAKIEKVEMPPSYIS